jgi:hypothetical protein
MINSHKAKGMRLVVLFISLWLLVHKVLTQNFDGILSDQVLEFWFSDLYRNDVLNLPSRQIEVIRDNSFSKVIHITQLDLSLLTFLFNLLAGLFI